MNPINGIIETACNALPERCAYARAVIRGKHRWSGSDLRGKAGAKLAAR